MKLWRGRSQKKAETLRGLIVKLHTRSAMWVMIMALVTAVISGFVALNYGEKDVTHLDRTEVENRYYASEGANEAELIVQEAKAQEKEKKSQEFPETADFAGMQAELDGMADAMKEGQELIDALYESFGESEAADEDLLSRIKTLKVHVGDLTGKIEQTESTLLTVQKEPGDGAKSPDYSALVSRVEELKKERDKTTETVEEVVRSVQSVKGFDADAALSDITTKLLECMNSEVEEEMTKLSAELKNEIDRKMDDFLQSVTQKADEEKSGADDGVTKELLASVTSLEQQIAVLKQQNEELMRAISSIQDTPVQTVSYTGTSDAEPETIVENVGLAELTDAEKKQLMEAMMDAQVMHAEEFRYNYAERIFADDVDRMLTDEAFP